MIAVLSGEPGAARTDAEMAAEQADVEVISLSSDRAGLAQELIVAVWGVQQKPQENLVRALSEAGTGPLVAVRGGAGVGLALGFVGWSDGLHLHSHMTAVRPGLESKGVGLALKLWQRCQCLEHGVTEIRWTYDPLIARNAYFNLVKLGAGFRRYLPDHYGQMDDVINAGDRSDRFEVSWRVDDPGVTAAISGRPLPAPAAGTTVAIPDDYVHLRRHDPARAREVREATRRVFAEQVAAGRRPVWSVAAGGYRFVPGDDGEGAGAG